ncbi:MAG TPA: tyrosine-type recombinase/integrase [Candidatus Faecousia intestinigallinarum]|nr:tyrosine-type recombinase/integrase [Candidatus Faecousia intestinigallinarum]
MAKVVAPPAKRTMPRVLTSHQIDCLLNSVSGETAHRDRTMFLLMVTAGLTMADLTGINRKDILSDRRIRIRGREGTQNRIIYLTAATEQSLQAYLSILDDADYRDSLHPYSPLFVSSVGKHGRLTPVMIRKRLTAAAKAAGIPDLSPTDLRDTAAAMLLKSNAERQDVFLYLGYRTPNAGGRFDHLVHKRCSEQSAMKEAIDASGLAHIGEGNYE